MGSMLIKQAENSLGSPSLDTPKPGMGNVPKVIKPPKKPTYKPVNPPKAPKPPGNKNDDIGMPSTKDVLKDIGKAQRSHDREAKKNPLKMVQGANGSS